MANKDHPSKSEIDRLATGGASSLIDRQRRNSEHKGVPSGGLQLFGANSDTAMAAFQAPASTPGSLSKTTDFNGGKSDAAEAATKLAAMAMLSGAINSIKTRMANQPKSRDDSNLISRLAQLEALQGQLLHATGPISPDLVLVISAQTNGQYADAGLELGDFGEGNIGRPKRGKNFGYTSYASYDSYHANHGGYSPDDYKKAINFYNNVRYNDDDVKKVAMGYRQGDDLLKAAEGQQARDNIYKQTIDHLFTPEGEPYRKIVEQKAREEVAKILEREPNILKDSAVKNLEMAKKLPELDPLAEMAKKGEASVNAGFDRGYGVGHHVALRMKFMNDPQYADHGKALQYGYLNNSVQAQLLARDSIAALVRSGKLSKEVGDKIMSDIDSADVKAVLNLDPDKARALMERLKNAKPGEQMSEEDRNMLPLIAMAKAQRNLTLKQAEAEGGLDKWLERRYSELYQKEHGQEPTPEQIEKFRVTGMPALNAHIADKYLSPEMIEQAKQAGLKQDFEAQRAAAIEKLEESGQSPASMFRAGFMAGWSRQMTTPDVGMSDLSDAQKQEEIDRGRAHLDLGSDLNIQRRAAFEKDPHRYMAAQPGTPDHDIKQAAINARVAEMQKENPELFGVDALDAADKEFAKKYGSPLAVVTPMTPAAYAPPIEVPKPATEISEPSKVVPLVHNTMSPGMEKALQQARVKGISISGAGIVADSDAAKPKVAANDDQKKEETKKEEKAKEEPKSVAEVAKSKDARKAAEGAKDAGTKGGTDEKQGEKTAASAADPKKVAENLTEKKTAGNSVA